MSDSELPKRPEIVPALPRITVGTNLSLHEWQPETRTFVPKEGFKGQLMYEIRAGRPVHLETDRVAINTSEVRSIDETPEGIVLKTRTGGRYLIVIEAPSAGTAVELNPWQKLAEPVRHLLAKLLKRV